LTEDIKISSVYFLLGEFMKNKFKLIIILIASIFYCVDAQWEELDEKNGLNPIGSSHYFNIMCDKNNVIVTDNFGKLFISTNNGDNWNVSSLNKIYSSVEHFTIKDSIIFVNSGDSVNWGKTFVSHDLGNTWVNLPLVNSIQDVHIIGNFTYFCKAGLIVRSLDYGKTIHDTIFAAEAFVKADRAYLTTNIDSTLFIVTVTPQSLTRVKDNGKIKENVSNGIKKFPPEKIEMATMGNLLFAFQLNNHLLYLSSDYGDNWSLVDSINNIMLKYIQSCNNNLFGPDGGVSISRDSGKTWIIYQKGLESLKSTTTGLAHNDNYVFNSKRSYYNPGGVYRAKLKDCEIVMPNDIPEISKDYSFSISPIPAESYIFLCLPPEYQSSTIKIYSVEGILVYQTSDIFKMSDVSAKIDVSSFPAGVYYVKVGDRVCRFIKI